MATESLTVEQTNALRQSLGLPPLTTNSSPSPPSSSPPAPPPPPDDPSTSISSLRAELARRQAARHASAVLSTASLSSQLQFSTAGSAAAWIQRHRSVMEEEAQRREARRREEEEARAKAGAPQYDAAQLRGLRIAHAYDAFEDEAEAVLVLRDKRIGEDDDGDELVNAELDDREKRQQAAGKAGKKGWEDDDDRPSLLAKYDEDEGEREGIVLGGGGQYGKAEEDRRRKAREDEERRERLVGGFGEALDGRVEYDISHVERKVDSEYADAPPQVAFKKKKDRKREAGDGATKSRSHRRDKAEEKPADDWMRQLEEEAKRGSANATSREDEERARMRSDEERRQKKTQGYLRALEKGEEATKKRLERDRQEEEEERKQRLALATAREAEEEDEELALAVERARRLTQREQQSVAVKVKVEGQEDGREVKVEPLSGIRALAERIVSEREEAAVKREGMKVEGRAAVNGGLAGTEDDDDGIVFTSVSNFATGLTAPEDSERAAKAEEDRPPAVKREQTGGAMDVDDHKGHQPNGAHTASARNGVGRSHSDGADQDDNAEDGDGMKEEGGKDVEDDEEEEEEEEDDIFGDEPLASGGIASALALAQRRAYISSAPSSEPAVGFNLAQYDALGRELSAKEKFRLLSHGFHGQGAGINKSDKRERSKKREVGIMQRVREKESMGVGQDNRQLLEAQRRLGQPYLVLDGAKHTGAAPTPAASSLTAGSVSDSRKRVKR